MSLLSITLGFVVILLLGVIYYFFSLMESYTQNIARLSEEQNTLQDGLLQLYKEKEELQEELNKEKENNKTILSQKKSSETRIGQMTEHLVPFLDAFPYNPKDAHFLGQPIDFIVFDYDQGQIVFVEVKTGNAKESARQKLIKNIVKSGRVYYEKIRINAKGVTVQKADNNE